MIKKVIIATKSNAEQIENLRSISYHNSKGFSVIDEQAFQNYCNWNSKDDNGLILLALNEKGDAVSCLRANVYFNYESHILNNKVFYGCSNDFLEYPTLDMTFATTHPNYYGNGIMSTLRYYMYVLNQHSVKSISGHVVKNSILHSQLSNLGYSFQETNFQRNDVKTVDNWMLASLNNKNFERVISKLKVKYLDKISEYPLIIM